MTEERSAGAPPEAERRMFLVVVDESEELHVALRFACRRAQRTGGRVALLYVMEPSDFAHWMAVKKVMEDAAHLDVPLVVETGSGPNWDEAH